MPASLTRMVEYRINFTPEQTAKLKETSACGKLEVALREDFPHSRAYISHFGYYANGKYSTRPEGRAFIPEDQLDASANLIAAIENWFSLQE